MSRSPVCRGNGGSGGAAVEFQPRRAEEVAGIRVTAKICELCGRMFFRDKQQKECRPCEVRLAKLAEPKAPLEPLSARAAGLRERMIRRAARAERMREIARKLAARVVTIQ